MSESENPQNPSPVSKCEYEPVMTMLQTWRKDIDPKVIIAIERMAAGLSEDDPIYQVLLLLGFYSNVMHVFPEKLNESLVAAVRRVEHERKTPRILIWFFGVTILLLLSTVCYFEWDRYQAANQPPVQRIQAALYEVGIKPHVVIDENGAFFVFYNGDSGRYLPPDIETNEQGNLVVAIKKLWPVSQ